MGKLKIDNSGRVVLYKEIRDILGLKPETELEYTIDTHLGTITIYNRERYGIKQAIDTRLKSNSITVSERKFLEKLIVNNKD